MLSFLFAAFSTVFGIETIHPVEKKSTYRTFASKPFLGIGMELVKLEELKITGHGKFGILIKRLVPKTAAEEAGLKKWDIILNFDGRAVESIEEDKIIRIFSNYIKEKKIGYEMQLTLLRLNILVNKKQHVSVKNVLNDLKKTIDELGANESLDINVKTKVKKLDMKIPLGQRPGILAQAPPKNSDLFPENEQKQSILEKFVKTAIKKHQLESYYSDVLTRFADNEWWDDGFRLNFFRYTHRDPLKLPEMTEELTAEIDNNIHPGLRDFSGLISITSDLLDEKKQQAFINQMVIDNPYPQSNIAKDHSDYVVGLMEKAVELRNQAFAAITTEEITFLYDNALKIPEKFFNHYYLDKNLPTEEWQTFQRILDLSHKIKYDKLLQAAMVLGRLADKTWLERMAMAFENEDINLQDFSPPAGMEGKLVTVRETSFGTLVVGGKGPNRYTGDAAVIIDLGGNDTYLSTSGASRSRNLLVSVLIDFEGDDIYSANESISQGSGFLGCGFLIDLSGNDRYLGTRFSQGTAVMGTGILIDYEGADIYSGQEFNQGAGLWGVGALIDFSGNDTYQSGNLAQGVGLPKGIGLLYDKTGNDSYKAGGLHPSSYGTKGIFKGSSQGFGIGFRNIASGGIGILLDSSGEDFFEAGNFSQGGGYFFGLGILKNGGSNDDRYLGSRYSQGFSAHSAVGILLDEGGNDSYRSIQAATQAAAWDLGAAILLDKSGNDVYDASYLGFSQGASAHNGFALFVDLEGKDIYLYQKDARGRSFGNDYHGGASLSLFIDAGGEDVYDSDMDQDNTTFVRGASGLFMDLFYSISSSEKL